MLAANIVPNHVSGAQEQVHEGALGIVIEERDAVKGAFVELPAFHFLFGGTLPLPGIVPQYLPNMEGP